MPPSCGMFVYRDLTSQVTKSVSGGKVCLLFSSISLPRKSLSSLRWEGRFSTSGCSWSSIHLEMLVVADLMVLQIGRAEVGVVACGSWVKNKYCLFERFLFLDNLLCPC